MATRNLVPRATGEGGIGTALKQWALGWINALVVNSIQIVTGAAAGKYLQSDAQGNASWQSVASFTWSAITTGTTLAVKSNGYLCDTSGGGGGEADSSTGYASGPGGDGLVGVERIG